MGVDATQPCARGTHSSLGHARTTSEPRHRERRRAYPYTQNSPDCAGLLLHVIGPLEDSKSLHAVESTKQATAGRGRTSRLQGKEKTRGASIIQAAEGGYRPLPRVGNWPSQFQLFCASKEMHLDQALGHHPGARQSQLDSGRGTRCIIGRLAAQSCLACSIASWQFMTWRHAAAVVGEP